MASREAHLRVIKINVGGHIYATTLRTLTKVPDSYLYKNFKNIASVPLPRDEAGYYFIDRDGPLFRHVLNYLRSVKVGRDMNLTGRVHLPEEFHEANQLHAEANFYQLFQMCEQIMQNKGFIGGHKVDQGTSKPKKSFSVEDLLTKHGRPAPKTRPSNPCNPKLFKK